MVYFQRRHTAARETSSKSELPTVHTNDPQPGECTEKPLTKLGSRDPDPPPPAAPSGTFSNKRKSILPYGSCKDSEVFTDPCSGTGMTYGKHTLAVSPHPAADPDDLIQTLQSFPFPEHSTGLIHHGETDESTSRHTFHHKCICSC